MIILILLYTTNLLHVSDSFHSESSNMFFAAISNQETAINTFTSFWVSNLFLGHQRFLQSCDW